ncbi:universal stress protein [Microvirga makkahensis]|uniref:Universal stress protein n=1 Tax=Microvirga makkahensis TaxID=1128670 RepID=A0A7X3MTH5_9HYPH|nr:universal stress protein [Microvirga makkahensis]MXQ12763.1 universal stress protein [Microvirga makkahensis]
MSFKDLLVLGGAGTEPARTYGKWLSGVTGACLTGAIPVVGSSLPYGIQAELPDDIVARIRDDAEASATKAIQDFMNTMHESGAKAETIRFDAAAGDIGYPFSRVARCFDLSILSQPDPSGLDTTPIIEAALFGSGRPLVIVPYIRTRQEIKTVLVAWDGGVQAARAASDALPLLMLARHVQVVTIGGEENRPHHSVRDLARHLARHGVEVEVRLLCGGGIDVANVLLSHAADSGADLIVMGGYGHSRLRELVLGGTTREILRSMTVPVFMSH